MPPRGTIADAKDFAQRARRLDRRASRPAAEGGAVSAGHRGAAARRARTGSCIAPASAARCGRKRATAARRSSASRATPSITDRRVHDFLKREARKDLQKAAQPYAAGARRARSSGVSIRDQSSRWGSCTSAGSLSFSWRLILAPPYVLDYLAAHEVAHLVEMNHSARFWRVVGAGLRSCRARQELARHPRQRSASLRHRAGASATSPLRTADPPASRQVRRGFRPRIRDGGARCAGRAATVAVRRDRSRRDGACVTARGALACDAACTKFEKKPPPLASSAMPPPATP